MKYEIGDRVKVKYDEECLFSVQEQLQKVNYIVTIIEIDESYYLFKEVGCVWREEYIEGLVLSLSCKEFFESIITRFELMEI